MSDIKIELIKDDEEYFIRKGICKPNCVCARLTIKDLAELMVKIDKTVTKNKEYKQYQM